MGFLKPRLRKCLHTSLPSMSGNPRSITIKSGSSFLASSIPFAAVSAVTTLNSPLIASCSSSDWRRSSSSSMTRIFHSLIMVFLPAHGRLLSDLQCRKLTPPSYPLIGLIHTFDPILVFPALSRKDAHDSVHLAAGRRRHLPGREAYRLSDFEFVRWHVRLVPVEPGEHHMLADGARQR